MAPNIPAPAPARAAVQVADAVALAPLTTLELGGPAKHVIAIDSEEAVMAAAAWASTRRLPLFVLGGGSNVVVTDAGFDGVVLRMAGLRGMRVEPEGGGRMLVHAAAGESWDALVQEAVGRGWAGLECLCGIPGLVGATPIQNVGAYGQEVAQVIRQVRVFDRASGTIAELDAASCAFGYRDSVFKRHPDAYVVLAVTFALVPGGPPTLRYRELEQEVGAHPSLAAVSAAVRGLRRKKSMVLDPTDPNRRSVGSFFTNPVLDGADAAMAVARAVTSGAAGSAGEVPQFPAGEGKVKLSAGWLVEHAGFARGYRRGAVGVSTNHALALVHHGGGRAAELLELARDVQAAVRSRFGVALAPEPVLVGGAWPA